MSGVRCINNIFKFKYIFLACLWGFLLSGCADTSLKFQYGEDGMSSAYCIDTNSEGRLTPYSDSICVVTRDIKGTEEIDEGSDSYASAALFSVNDCKVLYANNVYERLYPASMTKVMTALLAMKYGKKDDVLVCSDNVKITEADATVCGYKAGDTITLEQAMYGLMLKSGNDAAIAIAERYGGSVENFSEMMNAEARRIGATGTHFVNPNGLHNEEHYSTAYDMYLIFNEAMKNEWFVEIINTPLYESSYKDATGVTKEIKYTNTNRYITGEVPVPEGVEVIGGKTGTTGVAMSNLILLTKDSGGKSYISVVMRARYRDTLYKKMSSLINMID